MKLTSIHSLTAIEEPENGKPGDDGCTYYLTSNVAEVTCGSDGTPKNTGLQVTINSWVCRGNNPPVAYGGTISLYCVDASGTRRAFSAENGRLGSISFSIARALPGTQHIEAVLLVGGTAVHTLCISFKWDPVVPVVRSIRDMVSLFCASSSDSAPTSNSPAGWQRNSAEAPLSREYPFRWTMMQIFYSDSNVPVVSPPVMIGSLGTDGIGAYQLDLSNEMTAIGLVEEEGGYFPASEYNSVYTGFDLCGATNARITDTSIYYGNRRITTHTTGDEETCGSDRELGIEWYELRDGSFNVTFDSEVAKSSGSRIELDFRCTVEITEGINTRSVTLIRTWTVYFQPPGADGMSPIIHELRPVQDFISRDPNVQAGNVTLGCRVARHAGKGNFQILTDSEMTEEGLSVWYRVDGSETYCSFDYDDGEITLELASLSSFSWYLKNANGDIIDAEDIPVIVQGKNGIPGGKGERGAMIRGPQNWRDVPTNFTFQNGGEGCSFHDVILYNNQYYFALVSHQKSLFNYPGSIIDKQQGLWHLGDKFDLVATKLLLAEKGKINNLQVDDIRIYYDETEQVMFVADKSGLYICNKNGVQVFGLNTDGNIEAQGLKVMNAVFENVEVKGTSTFSGELKGVEGSFRVLRCIDREGNIKGYITFGRDGSIDICGDVSFSGPVDGRDARMYTSDIWGRGSFGTWKRNILEVKGSYGYIYTDGVYQNGIQVKFASASYNNNAYYKIPGYDFGDYGFPVDTIVFNISESTTYRYELMLAVSQRVMVVNANDSRNNIKIYSNGSEVGWNGGEMAEVINLSKFMNPSPNTSKPGRGLIIGAFRDNNWNS